MHFIPIVTTTLITIITIGIPVAIINGIQTKILVTNEFNYIKYIKKIQR